MNDDFETRLQRQPLRRIPAEWRAEILAAAAERRPAKVAGVTLASVIKSRLRELFWPAPQAWAGLAALWLVVLALNFATREAAPEMEARHAPPSHLDDPKDRQRRAGKDKPVRLADHLRGGVDESGEKKQGNKGEREGGQQKGFAVSPGGVCRPRCPRLGRRFPDWSSSFHGLSREGWIEPPEPRRR